MSQLIFHLHLIKLDILKKMCTRGSKNTCSPHMLTSHLVYVSGENVNK